MEAVTKLKSGNFIVGILSDQTDWLDVLNSRFDFFKHFDDVLNSCHPGKGKRDKSLFDDISGLLNGTPD
ncbi:MAG: hydrolase, partial [Lentisphaeria bacterium]|nr:hydrolase [Lentisphaeria bacterium]